MFSSCDKGQLGPVANTTDPEAPSITSPSSGESYTLSRNQADTATVMTLKWLKPDYGFTSAPTYDIQLDVAGNNFSDATEVASIQDTAYSIAVGDLNKMLLSKNLAGGQAHSIEIRVLATISDSVQTTVSSPVALSITPFQTDFPPIYMIGTAVSAWDPGQAVIVPSTEPNVYSTLAEFTNGEAFRFFGQEDWGPDSWNYPYFSTVDNLFVNANDNDSNFQFTGQTGWYKVTVNMDDKSVSLEAADEPIMYMTGSGIGGWNEPGTGESVKMTYVQDGVFEATTEFNKDGAFRFFAQAGWGPTSYNYPYFSDNDGTIDELLINAEDGDKNFQFTGETKNYYVKVNINDYIVEMEAK
ncbi:SusE domain-containing protein [Fodinibius saliphilus]|uniref:SusE domain-containing protein n=1 Tax=Fodinibius saliphilus TaxID=1920650 RepID=UPI001BB296B6|nr:SusE domain-containing protein [Fodinibius saliphilus]